MEGKEPPLSRVRNGKNGLGFSITFPPQVSEHPPAILGLRKFTFQFFSFQPEHGIPGMFGDPLPH